MKIERKLVEKSTIEAFAEKHDLVMEVRERSCADLNRFWAAFKRAEVKDGIILAGVYGNGDIEEEAIRDYARKISLQLLVVDAFGKERREIRVPRLLPSTQPEKVGLNMGMILDDVDDTPDTTADQDRPTLAAERIALAIFLAERQMPGRVRDRLARANIALNLGDPSLLTQAIEHIALALAARHPLLRHFEVAHAVAKDAVAALIADLSIVRKGGK